MTPTSPPATISITKSEHVKDDGLGEIYQSIDLRYALLLNQGHGKFLRITPFAKCRDFIGDVYCQPKAFEIYGCHFDPTKHQPDKTHVLLALKFPNAEARKNFGENISTLREIERESLFTGTLDIVLDENTTVTFGDARWAQNTLLLSLYTSLLRILCYKLEPGSWFITQMKEKHGRKEDGKLVKSVDEKVWRSVLADLSSIFTETFCGFDPTKEDSYTIHHNSGFYSVFGNHRELDKSARARNTHYQNFKAKGWPLHD